MKRRLNETVNDKKTNKEKSSIKNECLETTVECTVRYRKSKHELRRNTNEMGHK